jgi:hypothetical protein
VFSISIHQNHFVNLRFISWRDSAAVSMIRLPETHPESTGILPMERHEWDLSLMDLHWVVNMKWYPNCPTDLEVKMIPNLKRLGYILRIYSILAYARIPKDIRIQSRGWV